MLGALIKSTWNLRNPLIGSNGPSIDGINFSSVEINLFFDIDGIVSRYVSYLNEFVFSSGCTVYATVVIVPGNVGSKSRNSTSFL